MNIHTLKSYAKVRNLNQSDLARAAGVSRQAVSHWFSSEGEIDLYAKNLGNLARVLGVSAEVLSRPLPILSEPEERKKWETSLLWDRLYPDLESFVAGLLRGQRQALARLVQVCGIFQARKIAGAQVWKKFPVYKPLIPPAQRRQAETLWNLDRR